MRRTRVGTVLAVLVLAISGCTAIEPPGTSAASPTPVSSSSVVVRQVDGGPDFYSRFTDSLPDDPDFFPMAVWSESVVDDTGWPVEKAAGINVYLEPTADTDLQRIADNGMYAITSSSTPEGPVAGYFTADEADMWAGPGSAAATGLRPGEGDVCEPSDEPCGYSVMAKAAEDAPDGALRFTNYGKGVAYWESDEQAGRFVNEYQDVVSADVYWFTDPSVCAGTEGGGLVNDGETVPDDRCRLAANYGRTVERVRSLVDPPGSRPVWGFVEVGHPFREEWAPTITVPEIRAAVWSSLIAGARGITYFVHNFGGPCPTQHAIRDCGSELREGIERTGREVAELAPVLNSPSVDGLVHHDSRIATSTRIHGDALYILAGSTEPGPVDAEITVDCAVSTASVVGEGRDVPITDGRISDTFEDGNAVHIYQLPGGAACLT
ncbi:hypothetical protein [Rhodococcus sp. NBC_00294]|uniref:hypothetical protein n=1 Tax=Rhodococcus sp. NBC_00294 TaxID=2976004 RepID=UPI002E2C4772|nr:hypothetical protein [Rhodococcus sp. NBC_00294]